MKHRLFLKSSATLMGAVALRPTSSGSTTGAKPAERIRIGFLGASHSHAQDKLKTLLQSADYEVVGVCENWPTVLESCAKLGVQALTLARKKF